MLTSLLNDLVSPPVPSDELASALLFQAEQVAFAWPALAMLRSVARIHPHRGQHNGLVTRLVVGACYLLVKGDPPPGPIHAGPGAPSLPVPRSPPVALVAQANAVPACYSSPHPWTLPH